MKQKVRRERRGRRARGRRIFRRPS